ncbi:hypothetical protein [Poseidonocella sp. HB161398]|uniref:hypothetical protein n=1 Tax=Poseidonocella sp. HB161398 TaxID=2320855 RepID=UPI001108A5A7|nr:hypothetical protein [Poseidonocella sp. HB161398]
MPPTSDEILSQMTDAVQGQQAAPPQAAPPQQAAPQQAAPAAPKDTQQDIAAEKGSPETEGDAAKADAVVYDIPMGNSTRKMTPQQIAGTLQRYAALNHQHAQLTPVAHVLQQYAQSNPDLADPAKMAEALKATLLAQANQHNPTMGDDGRDNAGTRPQNATAPQQSAEDISAALKKWEEDNAATLPPGYADLMSSRASGQDTITGLQQQLQQMQRMLGQVLATAGGTADASRQGMQDAQAQRVQAIQGQIANNIDRVQQHLGLPDDAANDFMIFAAERGFTLEDFVDPNMTLRVMTDFRNQRASPEMERMRQMAQRRQAFTGTMGQTPSGGAGAPAPEGTTLDQMAASIMSRRQGG